MDLRLDARGEGVAALRAAISPGSVPSRKFLLAKKPGRKMGRIKLLRMKSGKGRRTRRTRRKNHGGTRASRLLLNPPKVTRLAKLLRIILIPNIIRSKFLMLCVVYSTMSPKIVEGLTVRSVG